MYKISVNCYKGELLTNPIDLIRLANERKSVYCNNVWGILPAAFMLGMTCNIVMRAINNKQLFYVINSKK